MKVIIGLGNMPVQYSWTRHNIAKDYLESLLFYKELQEYFYNDESDDLYYIIPKTNMNNSGLIFYEKKLYNWYKNNSIKEIIVLHDDLEVPFGKIQKRVNKERGHRGQNGCRSILSEMKKIKKDNFIPPYFLSIGIGRPSENIPVSNWVLKKYTEEEISFIKENIFNQISKELKTF